MKKNYSLPKRSRIESITVYELNAQASKEAMLTALNGGITPTELKDILKHLAANPVDKIRNKPELGIALPCYYKDSYKGQTIFFDFKGKEVILSCNRPNVPPKKYPLVPRNGETLFTIIKAYRNLNDLKCSRFIYENKNTGFTNKNQNAFCIETQNWFRKSAKKTK